MSKWYRLKHIIPQLQSHVMLVSLEIALTQFEWNFLKGAFISATH